MHESVGSLTSLLTDAVAHPPRLRAVETAELRRRALYYTAAPIQVCVAGMLDYCKRGSDRETRGGKWVMHGC